jgi:hypothetical protein
VGKQICSGAALACTFGAAPSTLTVRPANRVETSSMPAATVQDFAPMVNVAPFGMCFSPTNPQVAAATAAALGVLTPQPCMPALSTPWTPGSSTVLIGGQPALAQESICSCTWAGVISITSPGQATVETGP